MPKSIPLFLTVLACSSPAAAASRVFTVTSFDKIRVEGPYAVDLKTGRGPSARAEGDVHALDRLVVEVQGTTLIVKTDRSGWTGWPGQSTGAVSLAVTTPALTAAALNGSGKVSINRMAGLRVDVSIAGPGDVVLGAVETDRFGLNIAGSGQVTLAGRAATARVSVQGAGDVAAAGLTVADAEVTAAGSGNVALTATRSAKVKTTGSGNVVIGGKAACMVSNLGSGEVSCGGK